MQTRYYDPQTGRFINADGQLNSSLLGYNMFAYCNNNPIMFVDSDGKDWKGFWEDVGEFFYNIGNAIVSSIEAECGLGWGFGVEIEDYGAQYYWDFYVGLDDGTTVAGNAVSLEIAIAPVTIGDTYMHCSEKGDEEYFCKECGYDMSAKSIMNCSNSEKSTTYSIGPVSIKNNGDIIIGASVSAHVVLGGHASVGYNLSEFFRRLID